MYLNTIHLTNFKNHETAHYRFSKKVNCFIGSNGAGKTNLLDAIYYLCLTKSYFSTTDQQNIRIGADFMRLEANATIEGLAYHLVCKLPAGRKKEFLVNDLAYRKMSEHVGLMPVVMIAPDDQQLVTGPSEERRKFIDTTISQVDREYLEQLLLYNKYLDQRNALLKSINTTGRRDHLLLEGYNEKMSFYADFIYRKRKSTLEQLGPIFTYYYQTVSLGREATSFEYESTLAEGPLLKLLGRDLERDIAMERTLAGPHRDDIAFSINSSRLKRFGSQGQQKSFLIAIKLAQYHFIKIRKSFLPLLLIDDIFDKIDEERSRQLVKLLAGPDFGQIFLTDTEERHICAELEGQEGLFEVFKL